MVSRCIAILVCSMVPMFAATLPFGHGEMVNVMVSGIVATLLSFGSLVDNRFRIGVAVVGGWLALSPFLFSSTLLPSVVTVSCGVAMFTFVLGPFSEAPRVSFSPEPVAQPKPVVRVAEGEPELARAA